MQTEFAQQAGPRELRLYAAARTRKSIAAVANRRRICDERLPGRYRIEVIPKRSKE